MVYRLSLDPHEGHTIRSRAFLSRVSRQANVFDMEPPFFWDSNDRPNLCAMLKGQPPATALHWIKRMPCESAAARLAVSNTAMRYLLEEAGIDDKNSLQDLTALVRGQIGNGTFALNDETDYVELMARALLLSYCLMDEPLRVEGPTTVPSAHKLILSPLEYACDQHHKIATQELELPRVSNADMQALEAALLELSNKINDHKGGEIQRSKVKGTLLRLSFELRYMQALFGRKRIGPRTSQAPVQGTLHGFMTTTPAAANTAQ